MRTSKQPKSLLEKLVDAATLDNFKYAWPGSSKNPNDKRKPGTFITTLNKEDRELLSELQSDDIKDIRADLDPIKYNEDYRNKPIPPKSRLVK